MWNFQQEDDTVLFQSIQSTVNVNNTKHKKIYNIRQWCDAFDIYMSIYHTKHANSILPLIKYGNVICNMVHAFGFPAVKYYDEEFRKVCGLLRLDWATIHDELWRKALSSHNRPVFC